MATTAIDLDWLLLSCKLSKWAVLASTSAVAADMPLSYMIASEQPTDRTRFVNLGSPIVFTVDLTAAKIAQGISSIRCIALLYNNSGSTGTYTITGDLGYSSVNKPLWPSPDSVDFLRIHSYVYIPDGIPDNVFTITINDSAPRKPALNAAGFAVADYFEIGNLVIGYGVSSGANSIIRPAGSVTEGQDEESKLLVSEGGPIFPRIRPRSSRRSFNLRFITLAAYRNGMAKLRRDCGISESVLLLEDINNTTNYQMQQITYGLFDGLADISLPNKFEHFEVAVKIREML